jgi:hypothetical protein
VELKNRLHRRILAADAKFPQTFGKPLLYADTYPTNDEPETYVYARHICSPQLFFDKLNLFLASITDDNPELRNRNYPLLLAIKGKSRIGELPIPYKIQAKTVQHASFFRLDLPFGAMTVEFSKVQREAHDQLPALYLSRKLPQQLEAPLVGFDFTDGSLYIPLLLAVHWAADYIPRSVLEAALGEITHESIPA